MNSKKRESYMKHNFTQLSDLELTSDGCNTERKLMNKSSTFIVKFLQDNNINTIPDFCQMFKGLKILHDDVSIIILNLITFLNLEGIKPRYVKKTNCSEKNMIFTWIYLQNPKVMLKFVYDILSKKAEEAKKTIDMWDELQSKVSQIERQIQNTNLTQISYQSTLFTETNEDVTIRELPTNNDQLSVEDDFQFDLLSGSDFDDNFNCYPDNDFNYDPDNNFNSDQFFDESLQQESLSAYNLFQC